MEMKQSYISDNYHIIYLTFSKELMNEIFDEVKYENDVSDYKKEEDPKFLEGLVKEDIINQIYDRLTKLDVMPIGKPIIKFMKSINENSPLLVIVKTCVLRNDLNLHFPIDFNITVDYKKLEDKYQNQLIKKILLNNFEYELVPSSKVTSKSVVHFNISFSQDEITFDNLDNQIIDLSEKNEEFEYDLLIGNKVGDEVTLTSGEITTKAKITKIFEKKLNQLTDQVVLRLDFAQTKTVNEFKEKLKEITVFSTIVDTYSSYIINYIIQNHDYELDDDMKRHFLSFPHTEKDKTYLKNIQYNLISEAIGSLVSLSYEDKHVRKYNTLVEEFDLRLLLGDIDESEEMGILNQRENEVWIVQFFVDQGVIKIDI